jgi:hypothetical protein
LSFPGWIVVAAFFLGFVALFFTWEYLAGMVTVFEEWYGAVPVDKGQKLLEFVSHRCEYRKGDRA